MKKRINKIIAICLVFAIGLCCFRTEVEITTKHIAEQFAANPMAEVKVVDLKNKPVKGAIIAVYDKDLENYTEYITDDEGKIYYEATFATYYIKLVSLPEDYDLYIVVPFYEMNPNIDSTLEIRTIYSPNKTGKVYLDVKDTNGVIPTDLKFIIRTNDGGAFNMLSKFDAEKGRYYFDNLSYGRNYSIDCIYLPEGYDEESFDNDWFLYMEQEEYVFTEILELENDVKPELVITAYDEETGETLSGCYVVLEDEEGNYYTRIKTDSTGKAVFKGAPEGIVLYITVTRDNDEYIWEPLQLAAFYDYPSSVPKIGAYLTKSIPTTTYILGDVDHNGKINSSDAVSILEIYSNGTTLDTNEIKICDVNGDGKINSSDAAQVLEWYQTGEVKYITL